MKKLSTQVLNKPKNLSDHNLIAIIGIYDQPANSYSITDMPYTKSEIAVNESEGKVQVYIMASNKNKLNKFKADFPDAKIQTTAALEEPDNWKVIAFPTEAMPDESTALDNYFLVRGREMAQAAEGKSRKERRTKNDKGD